MSDYIEAGAYIFDLVFATLILLSAFMAFARGFIREVTSVFALAMSCSRRSHRVPGFTSAHCAHVLSCQRASTRWCPHAGSLPITGLSDRLFALSAWIGAQVLHASSTAATDIGLIDRIIGFISSVWRAECLVVFPDSRSRASVR